MPASPTQATGLRQALGLHVVVQTFVCQRLVPSVPPAFSVLQRFPIFPALWAFFQVFAQIAVGDGFTPIGTGSLGFGIAERGELYVMGSAF